MTVVVIGRVRTVVDTVVSTIQSSGYHAIGVTTPTEALAVLAEGGVTTLVIGGGVDRRSRGSLQRTADVHGVEVIHGALGRRSPEVYARQQIVPRLGRGGRAL